jgi:hypothetical protein
MKLKTLLVASTLAFSGSASAMDYTWGDLTLATDNEVSGFFNVPLNLNNMFDDNHFFSVSLPSTGSGTLSNSIVFNTDGSFRKVIAGMAAYLWLDSGTVGSHDGSDIQILELGTSAEGTKTANYISDTGSLPTGSYFIEVTGYGAGTKGGSYSFIASAVPVPEPETWAMLVAGLGLVGLQLRRRTNTGKISIN